MMYFIIFFLIKISKSGVYLTFTASPTPTSCISNAHGSHVAIWDSTFGTILYTNELVVKPFNTLWNQIKTFELKQQKILIVEYQVSWSKAQRHFCPPHVRTLSLWFPLDEACRTWLSKNKKVLVLPRHAAQISVVGLSSFLAFKEC